jgi:hypothetical protein
MSGRLLGSRMNDQQRAYLKELVALIRSVVDPYEEGQSQIRKHRAQMRAEQARIARTPSTS